MCRQDSEKEIEEFYLQMPEEKILYPIDLEWDGDNSILDSLKLTDNLNINPEKSIKQEIEIKEINLKKFKKRIK